MIGSWAGNRWSQWLVPAADHIGHQAVEPGRQVGQCLLDHSHVVREVFPWEEFVLARTLVDTGVADGESEDDLFAGLRAISSSTPR